MATEKPIHTIVLDAGPIIKGDPSISSLLAQSEQLVTLPSVIQEIRDEATRTRLQTTFLPFLVLKSPKESSVKIISDFARRTGDLSVLSRVDTRLLALAYDLECERNGGDWRLRKTPGEKRINGANPNASRTEDTMPEAKEEQISPSEGPEGQQPVVTAQQSSVDDDTDATQTQDASKMGVVVEDQTIASTPPVSREIPDATTSDEKDITAAVEAIQLSDASHDGNTSDSDSEGWITPSNLKKKLEEDSTSNTNSAPEPKVLQVVSQSCLVPQGSRALTRL